MVLLFIPKNSAKLHGRYSNPKSITLYQRVQTISEFVASEIQNFSYNIDLTLDLDLVYERNLGYVDGCKPYQSIRYIDGYSLYIQVLNLIHFCPMSHTRFMKITSCYSSWLTTYLACL